jgi:predicted permease
MHWPFFLGNLRRDFLYAIRSLRKDRRLVGTAVFALALGIGASTVVFSVFYNLLFNAIAAKDAGRLVVPVVADLQKPGYDHQLWINWADLEYLRGHNQLFENLVGSHSGIAAVQYGARTYQLENGHVSPDAFDFYGVAPFLGRAMVAEDGKPGASAVFVMSYRTWKGEFGGETGIVGKSFVIEGEPATLIGVMPERFNGFGATQEFWVPVGEQQTLAEAEKKAHVNVQARLKQGVKFAAASAEIEVLVKRLASMHPDSDDYPKKFTARVVPANEYLMGPSGAATVFNSKIDLKRILYDLLAAVLVLLLIACSNVANLLLARMMTREKEMALRSALGASRWQIASQLLMESLVLALCACTVGSALGWMAMRTVNATIHQKAWAHMSGEAVVGLNGPVLLFAAGITLLTTVVCGLIPALRVTSRDLQPQLAGSNKGAGGGLQHGKVRAALLIGQVALSIVLLIEAGLMMRSLYQLTHIDLGFNANNILVAAFAPSRKGDQLPDRALMTSAEGHARFQRAVEKIREVPGVTSVAVNNTIPGYGPSAGPRVGVPGETQEVEAGMDECDENCLDTLEMRLIAGRWLSRSEVQTRQFAAVINERLAHTLFGNTNPVGKQLEVKGFKSRFPHSTANLPENPVFEIVGVVGDTKNAGPQAPALPMAFIPPMIAGDFMVQVRTKAEPGSMMHAVQEAVWSVDRGQVFWVLGPLAESLEQHTYAAPEFGVSLSGPLAGITLLLVVIGVFSVMAYTVSLQTQEIGVRMALGAQRAEILGMVLRKGFSLLVAGIFVGVIGSFALTRFLASQIWGVSPTDPWTFMAVVALLLGVGLAACYLPSQRATRVDPLVALRYE